MTPLARMLARYVPAPMVTPALALVYATLIVGIVWTSRRDFERIIYVDVRGK